MGSSIVVSGCVPLFTLPENFLPQLIHLGIYLFCNSHSPTLLESGQSVRQTLKTICFQLNGLSKVSGNFLFMPEKWRKGNNKTVMGRILLNRFQWRRRPRRFSGGLCQSVSRRSLHRQSSWGSFDSHFNPPCCRKLIRKWPICTDFFHLPRVE